jgi:alpha-L-fucosidase
MEANGENIYGYGAARMERPEWGRYTQKGDVLYAHILERPWALCNCVVWAAK